MRLYKLPQAPRHSLPRPPFTSLLHPCPSGSGWLITQGTRDPREGAVRWRPPREMRATEPYDVAPEVWQAAAARIHLGFAAAVNSPVPPEVRDEATLWLLARPGQHLEYMGRGRYMNKERLPAPLDQLRYFDVAGGRRSYAFRVMDTRDEGLGDRSVRVHENFASKARWADDPEARIVLSVGGGGYRLFAAQAALKVMEQIFRGDRSKIHEVWGSSGGSLLGYAFANGLDLSVIDELGYCLYHGREVAVPGLHLSSLVSAAVRIAKDLMSGRVGLPELTAWVDAVERMCPPHLRRQTKVPFFTMVSSVRRNHPVAFADPAHVSAWCSDIILPSQDMRLATAASMSIPFLMRPLRHVHGTEEDLWFDGSIVDENPVMLPFIKWLRDREADPEHTPKRLKIILINLNMRLAESQTFAAISDLKLPIVSDIVRRTVALADLLLDSKTYSVIRTLCALEDVEILASTLSMGRLNFLARNDIPAAIRCGQLVEGWKYELFKKGTYIREA